MEEEDEDEDEDATWTGFGGRLTSFLSPWMGTSRRAVTFSGIDRVDVDARELVDGLEERRGESAGVSARDELLSMGYCWQDDWLVWLWPGFTVVGIWMVVLGSVSFEFNTN